MMLNYFCIQCQEPFPQDHIPVRCPVCGGIFDFADLPTINLNQLMKSPLKSGMWRYQSVLGLPDNAPLVTLGEGATPLIWLNITNRKVAFKLEFTNPTGSYKDRGAAVLVSFLLSRNANYAVEDSSGNAGAAFAAYAAYSGIKARLYIPENTSTQKRKQIEAYQGEVIQVEGPRSNAAEEVKRAVKQGYIYASHAYLPHLLPGYATIAYEIYEQLGNQPGTIIAPVGQGNLLLAIARGFESLRRSKQIVSMPILVGVQAEKCAPLWTAYASGSPEPAIGLEGDTLAEGIRVMNPIRGKIFLQTIKENHGSLHKVSEEEIIQGRNELAKRGLYVELTSAVVWSILEKNINHFIEPIVVILTGSGLKTSV
jgi:threonine synthase